jgi:hypothetical protein
MALCVSQCGRMLELECDFVCVRIIVILHKAATPQLEVRRRSVLVPSLILHAWGQRVLNDS